MLVVDPTRSWPDRMNSVARNVCHRRYTPSGKTTTMAAGAMSVQDMYRQVSKFRFKHVYASADRFKPFVSGIQATYKKNLKVQFFFSSFSRF